MFQTIWTNRLTLLPVGDNVDTWVVESGRLCKEWGNDGHGCRNLSRITKWCPKTHNRVWRPGHQEHHNHHNRHLWNTVKYSIKLTPTTEWTHIHSTVIQKNACLSYIYLVWPINVNAIQAVACIVPLHGDRNIVIAIKHDRQWYDEVNRNHSQCVGDKGPEGREQKQSLTQTQNCWGPK